MNKCVKIKHEITQMTTKQLSILDRLTLNPKKLFLIDSIGAFLTAFILFAILSRYEERFGMPRKVLYVLSVMACIYAIYSIYCYYFIEHPWQHFLKIIGIANLLYCMLTIGLVIAYHQSITILGFIYFLLEISVIGCLVIIELKASNFKK